MAWKQSIHCPLGPSLNPASFDLPDLFDLFAAFEAATRRVSSHTGEACNGLLRFLGTLGAASSWTRPTVWRPRPGLRREGRLTPGDGWSPASRSKATTLGLSLLASLSSGPRLGRMLKSPSRMTAFSGGEVRRTNFKISSV